MVFTAPEQGTQCHADPQPFQAHSRPENSPLARSRDRRPPHHRYVPLPSNQDRRRRRFTFRSEIELRLPAAALGKRSSAARGASRAPALARAFRLATGARALIWASSRSFPKPQRQAARLSACGFPGRARAAAAQPPSRSAHQRRRTKPRSGAANAGHIAAGLANKKSTRSGPKSSGSASDRQLP
jgi:hypothetical protein